MRQLSGGVFAGPPLPKIPKINILIGAVDDAGGDFADKQKKALEELALNCCQEYPQYCIVPNVKIINVLPLGPTYPEASNDGKMALGSRLDLTAACSVIAATDFSGGGWGLGEGADYIVVAFGAQLSIPQNGGEFETPGATLSDGICDSVGFGGTSGILLSGHPSWSNYYGVLIHELSSHGAGGSGHGAPGPGRAGPPAPRAEVTGASEGKCKELAGAAK